MMRTHVEVLLEGERQHMLSSVQAALKDMGRLAQTQLESLTKYHDSETLNLDLLSSHVEGLRVAVAKIGTLNHTLRLLDMDRQRQQAKK